MMQGVRTLFDSTMDGLKMEKLDAGITHLAGMDIMSFIIVISLVIYILSFKKWFGICAKY